MTNGRIFLVGVFALACGSRSSLTDAFDDASGNSGGSSVGGLGAGGRASVGGFGVGAQGSGGGEVCSRPPCSAEGGQPPGGSVSSGGANPAGGMGVATGGSGERPCAADEFDADPGAGVDCQRFEDCSPGEYVVQEGTPLEDRRCAACPPYTYSHSINQAECLYAGCLFSQRVVKEGTPSAPAECEPDPNYDAMAGSTSSSAGGLAALGAGVQAAMVVLGAPYETSIFSYEGGARMGERPLALNAFERPVSLALALDGSIYLSGLEEITRERWARAFPADTAEWTVSVPPSYHPESGVATQGTEGLFWYVEHRDDGSSGFGLSLQKFTLAGPPTSSLDPVLNVEFVSGVVMDGQGAFWIVKGAFGEAQLLRYDSQTGISERVLDVDANVAEVVATQAGVAYAVTYWYDPDLTFRVHEIGPDANTRRIWTWKGTTAAGIPKAIAIDPDRAVYVAGICWDPETLTTDLDACISRVDLSSGEVESRSFVGPWEDRADYIAVTSDGEVYLSGVTHELPETRLFRAYVRRVLF